MSEPIFSDATERLYAGLPEAYPAADADLDWVLKRWLSGVVDQLGAIETLINRFAYTTPDAGGSPTSTSDLVDPATADTAWLPWLAQLVGMRLAVSGLGVPAQRLAIASALQGNKPGTKAAIAEAAQKCLTGTKRVRVFDHSTAIGVGIGTGTMWDVLIVTRASETLINLMPVAQATMASTSAWTATVDGGATTYNLILDTRIDDSHVARVRSDADGDVVFAMNPAGDPIAVTDGDPYTHLLTVHGGQAGPYAGTMLVTYLDSGDTPVGTDTATGDVTGTPTQFAVQGTTPVNAVKAWIQFTVADGLDGDVWYFSRGCSRLGDNTDWIAQTADPVQTVIDAGAKPAGVTLHADTYEADWSTIEADRPTWADWDGSTWDEVEETGLDD